MKVKNIIFEFRRKIICYIGHLIVTAIAEPRESVGKERSFTHFAPRFFIPLKEGFRMTKGILMIRDGESLLP